MGQNLTKINAIQSKSYKIEFIIIVPEILNKLLIKRRIEHSNRASIQNRAYKIEFPLPLLLHKLSPILPAPSRLQPNELPTNEPPGSIQPIQPIQSI